jgi:arsenate reductase
LQAEHEERSITGAQYDLEKGNILKKKVLFICTHNSARSQMAEGFLNSLCGDRYEGYSAGIEPTKLNPYISVVMSEVGVDVSKQYSKNVEGFLKKHFDYVVTVCDQAREACPFFPADNVIHKSFRDPSRFSGSEDIILRETRLVRDKIREWIAKTFCIPQ